jgi:two-component system osmolarity sensor histidine kinase EnvZ
MSFWRKAAYIWRKNIPRSLYNRTLIIVVAPVLLVQLVVTLVFLERNLERDTRLLSAATAGDIAGLVALYDHLHPHKDVSEILPYFQRLWGLEVHFVEKGDQPPRVVPLFSFNERVFHQQLSAVLGGEVVVHSAPDPSMVAVDLNRGDQIMRILVRKSRVYASNYHILLLWMLSTAVVSLGVAVLFLRNQIRPLSKLAQAAEMFGKGRSDSSFQPRGALEIRQVGAAFLSMKERIEQFMNQRIMLLNGVSHDLNTLLTRFKLSLALFPESEGIADLQNDVGAMEKILRDYLEFARDDGIGEKTLAVPVKDILEDVIKSVSSPSVSVAIECAAQVMCVVRPTAFRRLLLNIFSNGARYGQRIQVDVKRTQGRVRIDVHDDGPGIPEDLYETAFMPFARLDSSRDLEHGHSGLGLTIARDIARSHGGEVTLGRSLFGGALVTIEMPA